MLSSAKRNLIFILAVIFFCRAFPASSVEVSAGREDKRLMELMRIIQQSDPPPPPPEEMYLEGDIIMCTGGSTVAAENNKAVKFMQDGDYAAAVDIFTKAMKHAPLFFPFRYNAGICYIFLNSHERAFLNLEKAKNLVPEFYKTYQQIGYVYELEHKVDPAIGYYRQALRKNPRAYDILVAIGDVYFDRNQLEAAGTYYQASLSVNPGSPNALLGTAKIYFKRKSFLRALTVIKSISLEKEYDKVLHFYYAECAYKLREYQTAYDQYNKLLEFRNDKFFLTYSVSLIYHKIDLCRRFIEVR